MHKADIPVLEIVATAALVAIAMTVLFLLFPGLKGEAAAAWVQAVGSIAAIAGAVWIASSQERYRRAEALTVPRVAAAGMVFRLTLISSEIKGQVTRFDTIKVADASWHDFAAALSILEAQPSWSATELVLLAPLPLQCAYKIAGGLDRLNSTIALLQKFLENPSIKTDSSLRKERASTFSFLLNEAAGSFDLAAERMQLETLAFTSPYH